MLVPAHSEVVDAAYVGPVETRWKVLHIDVLVRQRLRDALAFRKSSCIKERYGRAREQSWKNFKMKCLLFGTLHGFWERVAADTAPRRTASK